MGARQIPERANRPDWSRLVSQAFGQLDRAHSALTERVDALPDFAALGNFVDDAAAATGGVAVGHLYRNGSVLMVRVA